MSYGRHLIEQIMTADSTIFPLDCSLPTWHVCDAVIRNEALHPWIKRGNNSHGKVKVEGFEDILIASFFQIFTHCDFFESGN